MFRLLQGDVGSGKTIVSLIAASNVIESNFQTTFMAPTEILAEQHYNLAKTIFKGTNIKIGFLTGRNKNFGEKNNYRQIIKWRNSAINRNSCSVSKKCSLQKFRLGNY